MRVRSKLITMTLFVAVVPLAVSAFQSVRIHERAVEDALLHLHGKAAHFGATTVDDYFSYVKASLRTMVEETIQWDSLSEEELQGALWLVYGQLDSSVIVQLRQAGEAKHQVFLKHAAPDHLSHPPLTPEDIAEFGKVVPPASEQGRIGAPIKISEGSVVVPIAFSNRPNGSAEVRTFAVGISVSGICRRLELVKPTEGRIALFDRFERALCPIAGQSPLSPVGAAFRQVLEKGDGSYDRHNAGEELRGTVATVLDGWHVVVEQPMAVITGPTLELRNQAVLWLVVGAAAAIASGLILAQSVHRPLQQLTEGAREIGAGNLGYRLDSDAGDEFGQLAEAFNTMSMEIAARDAEIRDWNTELQQRVEERGRQLKRTQDALLRSQKMAGLSTLTAGIAHEMNNPLTGVLGLTQVLASKAKKRDAAQSEQQLFDSVVSEAKRMQRLLAKMEALNESQEAEEYRAVSVQKLMDGVLLAERGRMDRLGIELKVEYNHQEADVLGDQYQLNQVFQGLVDNALRAMSEKGGELHLSTQCPDREWVIIQVRDTGHGIRPEELEKVIEPFYTTKTGGAGEGLGLTLIYQTVQAHGGTLDIRSEWQKGTTVEVRLPTIGVRAHLA